MVEITNKPINIDDIIKSVASQNAGAIDVFIGTVRNNTKGKAVVKLDFEAYEPMAISELQKIVNTAKQKWAIEKVAVVHRVGLLALGEVPVVIAVSTPHRKDAFDACQFIIDTLKETVPIWKKEIFDDGAVWVSAHP